MSLQVFVSHPVPQNVTLFGSRVPTGLKLGHRSVLASSGPCVLPLEGARGHRLMEGRPVKTWENPDSSKPGNPVSPQEPGEESGQLPPGVFPEEPPTAMLISCLWPQNYETVVSVCFRCLPCPTCPCGRVVIRLVAPGSPRRPRGATPGPLQMNLGSNTHFFVNKAPGTRTTGCSQRESTAHAPQHRIGELEPYPGRGSPLPVSALLA